MLKRICTGTLKIKKVQTKPLITFKTWPVANVPYYTPNGILQFRPPKGAHRVIVELNHDIDNVSILIEAESKAGLIAALGTALDKISSQKSAILAAYTEFLK